MKFLLVLSSLALAALAIPGTSAGSFTNCAQGSTDFTAASASLTPASPCPGQNICFTVSGQLSTDIINGAELQIYGRWLNKIVYADHPDIGTLLAAAGTPLPFPASAPGTNTDLTLCTPLKKGFPTGIPTQFTFQLLNGDGDTSYCQVGTITAATC